MRDYLSLIKFSHTIFALPFAMVGYILGLHAPGAEFDWSVLILVVLCMVFGRSAAMAFNRYADREIDALNERTKVREIPSGKISPRSALIFTIANVVLFVGCTYLINPLCFALSPVALAVVMGYSYTKRFTPLSHFVLGVGLALAPVGAYLAVTETFDLIPVLLGFVVLLWVTGFDIIYALQDEDFDTQHQLYSIPSKLGAKNALRVSTLLHAVCALICVFVARYLTGFDQTGVLIWIGTGLFVASLAYQHSLVKPGDLSKVNLAFFTTNGIASLAFGAAVVMDFYV